VGVRGFSGSGYGTLIVPGIEGTLMGAIEMLFCRTFRDNSSRDRYANQQKITAMMIYPWCGDEDIDSVVVGYNGV
jgi:hypothetical protein